MDYDQQHWAEEMKALLQEVCHAKKAWTLPPQLDVPVKRGRKKKSKAANLGERIQRYKAAILRFLQDAQVPFDNSLAERDMRMMKVKKRSQVLSTSKQERAEQFTLIRSFLSSLRKQKRDILPALLVVIRG